MVMDVTGASCWICKWTFWPLKFLLKQIKALTPTILTFIQNLLYRQWISRSLFTRKFYLFFLNISCRETDHFWRVKFKRSVYLKPIRYALFCYHSLIKLIHCVFAMKENLFHGKWFSRKLFSNVCLVTRKYFLVFGWWLENNFYCFVVRRKNIFPK